MEPTLLVSFCLHDRKLGIQSEDTSQEKSPTNRDLMSSAILVLVLVLVVECSRQFGLRLDNVPFAKILYLYSANTMSSALEVMGLSLPYSSSIPAEDPGECS